MSNITLRDYLAGQIISGIIANTGPAGYSGKIIRAYQIADEMIKVSLEKK